jgi:glutathione synthase
MSDRTITLGVVMDPIETIKPAKDSTLAMLLAAQSRGWNVVYFRQRDVWLAAGEANGIGRRLGVQDDEAHWFEYTGEWAGPLGELDVILMRKDPPFDMEYVYTTYVLERAETAGALVVNQPRALRDMNEKAYTAWFSHCTPPTMITRSITRIREFLAEHGRIVVKPLDGMGGRSVFVVDGQEPNRNVIMETITADESRYAVAQRYLPEIRDGDKRILMIDGEPVPKLLARIPAADDTRGNLVMGARGEGRPLSPRDRWIAEQVGPVLKARGVVFAGLDVIGEYLTEINVTSPTGIRELDRAFGLDIAGRLMDAIEARLAAGRPEVP